jgi:hypothetical protein
MKPSVGRIVHYVSYGTPGGEYTSQCRAAVITAARGHDNYLVAQKEDTVDLCVLNPEGLFFNRNVEYSEDKRGGSWHWPERED